MDGLFNLERYFDNDHQLMNPDIKCNHKEWHQEAKSRGILNITNIIDELEAIIADKNVQLFENLNIMTKTKCQSKYEVKFGSYAKTISTESVTLVHMVKREVIPAVISVLGKVAQCITQLETA
ncbi:MAG: hypothetical protein EZS28_004583 [Streblomastix strix]|uniref:Glutamine synthetase C-terminal domain-containing protein n=1 Tax=Streblomastix strix TaxID=222440 RepID=A0A5J4WXS6_9EUKA|nr:MAG: hypothetical protein EZS28_004583 [Streblomastix strix]